MSVEPYKVLKSMSDKILRTCVQAVITQDKTFLDQVAAKANVDTATLEFMLISEAANRWLESQDQEA